MSAVHLRQLPHQYSQFRPGRFEIRFDPVLAQAFRTDGPDRRHEYIREGLLQVVGLSRAFGKLEDVVDLCSAREYCDVDAALEDRVECRVEWIQIIRERPPVDWHA